MVAYSFDRQFEPHIRARTKRQTLRNDRKRHAHEGEAVSLYFGMRTKACRLIGTAKCIGVSRLRLDFEHGRIESLDTGNAWTTLPELDGFAQIDGFAGWRSLEGFWRKAHPDIFAMDMPAWEGIRIQWGETFVPAVEVGGKFVPGCEVCKGKGVYGVGEAAGGCDTCGGTGVQQ